MADAYEELSASNSVADSNVKDPYAEFAASEIKLPKAKSLQERKLVEMYDYLKDPAARIGEFMTGAVHPLANAYARINDKPYPPELTSGTAKAGEVVGDMLLTLPRAMMTIPGMAIYEAATAPKGQEFENAVRGAIVGAAGSAGTLLNSMVKPEARLLMSRGVQPTPGQAYGGFGYNAERAASKFPGIGQAVNAARTRAENEFNASAYEAAGLNPRNISGMAPNQMLDAAQAHVDDLYNSSVPHLQAPPNDINIHLALNRATQNPLLTAEQRQQLVDYVKHNFGNYTHLTGEQLKDLDSQLGYQVRRYSRAQDPAANNLGEGFRTLQAALRNDFVANAPPEIARTLREADRANYELVALENAAAKDPLERISPRGLQQAMSRQRATIIPNLVGDQAELARAGTTVLGPTPTNTRFADQIAAASAMVNPQAGLISAGLYPFARLLTSRDMAAVLTGGETSPATQFLSRALRAWGGRKSAPPTKEGG